MRRFNHKLHHAFLTTRAGRFTVPLKVLDGVISAIFIKILSFIEKHLGLISFTTDSAYGVSWEWHLVLRHLTIRDAISSPNLLIERPFSNLPFFITSIFSSEKFDTDGYKKVFPGRGQGTSLEETISRTIGEFLERYTLSLYRRNDFKKASIKELRTAGLAFLNPLDLAGFADWQKEHFPRRKVSDDSSFLWTIGEGLVSGVEILLPAQTVFWNYQLDENDFREPYLRQPITNGAAGHFSKEEAVISGICELVHRDAFLIFWLNRISPPRVDTKTVESPIIHRFIEELKREKTEVLFLNITIDIAIPSFVCILIEQASDGDRYAMASSASPKREQALFGSLSEAIMVRNHLKRAGHSFSLPSDYKPFFDPSINTKERLHFWYSEHLSDDARFLMQKFLSGPLQAFKEAPTIEESDNHPQVLKELLEMFTSKGEGYEVYCFEKKHPILDELGYKVVRIIIPALAPFYQRETDIPLGSSRLRSVPSLLGVVPQSFPNPFPHPL